MKRIVWVILTAVLASGCYAAVGRTHTTAVVVDTHHHHHHHWH